MHYQENTKLYYMYYSVSELGKKNSVIGVASSPTMEVGSWTDHGSIGLDTSNNPPYNTIDANWIRIGDTPYLNWGSFWQNLFQVRMENPLKISGDARRQIAFNGTLNHRIEAAFEFQHGNFYYLTFSSGIGGNYDQQLPPQGNEYSVRVCRSEGGKGNFVSRPLVSTDPPVWWRNVQSPSVPARHANNPSGGQVGQIVSGERRHHIVGQPRECLRPGRTVSSLLPMPTDRRRGWRAHHRQISFTISFTDRGFSSLQGHRPG